MAKSEHQGLQIALILFVMITVVLAITTFVYYKQSEESDKIAKEVGKKMEAATTRANDFQARVDYVLHILGQVPRPDAEVELMKQSFAADPQMSNVISEFDKFILTVGSGLPKDKQNYAGATPAVLTALRNSNTTLIQQTIEATQKSKDLDAARADEAKRTEVATKGQQDAERRAEQEKTTYLADRKSLEDSQKAQLATFTTEISKQQKEVAAAKDNANNLTKEVAKRETTISDQANTIKQMRDEPFEVPDGQITWVNQSAKTVWVNLGVADGLRRQTLFSVFDQADNGVTRTEKKASVEVTRVLDQHLCEARIVDDMAANPILPGDQVFSPAWRPGKRVRFALTGILDIDGDGRSDRNIVRSLLVAGGGAIDEEMFDDGEINKIGEGMTSGTRYLVLGERPDDRTEPKILASYSDMKRKAEELGVEVINIDKLLDWVGYRPEARSVGLGKNADPTQFKPTHPDGKAPTSTGVVSEKFRGRKPGENAKKGSAFDKK